MVQGTGGRRRLVTVNALHRALSSDGQQGTSRWRVCSGRARRAFVPQGAGAAAVAACFRPLRGRCS
jgi:hypothetical protein